MNNFFLKTGSLLINCVLSLLQVYCGLKTLLTIQQNIKLRELQKSQFLYFLMNWEKFRGTIRELEKNFH